MYQKAQNSMAVPHTKQAQFMSLAPTSLVGGQKEKKNAMQAYMIPITLRTGAMRPNFHGPRRKGSRRIRLRRIKQMGTMYEASTLATLRETMALKAVVEPMLMRARRRLITTVIPIE